jgi:hypothetical protein
MIFGYFILVVALTISAIAEYYSIVGLTAIFSAAFWPIVIMGASLGLGKVTAAVWLKLNWERAAWTYKLYLVPAVAFLMLLTSMGIFGFLSKAHSDQSLVSGDVQSRIAIYDEKIKTAKENIESNRKQLKQMDEAVDQVMARSQDEKGADKANAIRKSQSRDRLAFAKDIEANQKLVIQLNDEAAPIRAEVRKVEAEVGPIKYIAAMIYSDNPDANVLEKAVRFVIILIVAVFDPLALVLILAAQQTLRWEKESKEKPALRFDGNTIVGFDVPAMPRSAEPQYKETVKPDTVVPDPEELTANKQSYHSNKTVPVVPELHTPEDTVDQPVQTENTAQESAVAVSVQPIEELLDRPGDYLTAPEMIDNRVREAAPARNRGVMHTHLVADNATDLGKPSNTGFGQTFPASPSKGDVFLRVDSLPNRLYKYNGIKWIEVDKSQTDVYAYEEEYIKYLIEQIDLGKYDPDILTDIEKEQIQQYLGRNA